MNSRNCYDYICTALAALLLVAMYVFPDIVRDSASHGVSICLTKVIPSLMPYIITTKILSLLLLKLQKYKTYNYNVDASIWIMLLGLLSGFPNGALLTSSFYKNRTMNKEKAEILISCSNSISPAFCISIFGADVLNGSLYGLITFISLIIVNITLYLIQCKITGKETERNTIDGDNKSNIYVITSSITDGMMTVINICAFVIYFMCFSSIIQAVLRLMGFENDKIAAALCSLIEITCGIEKLTVFKYGARFIIGNALVGFGGLSAIMQVISVCNLAGLSSKRFLTARIISMFTVPWISFVILLLIPSNVTGIKSFAENVFLSTSTHRLVKVAIILLLLITITRIVIKRRKEYKKSKIFL